MLWRINPRTGQKSEENVPERLFKEVKYVEILNLEETLNMITETKRGNFQMQLKLRKYKNSNNSYIEDKRRNGSLGNVNGKWTQASPLWCVNPRFSERKWIRM